MANIEFYGGYQVYSESGIDLTLLRANLKRTAEERWGNNQSAVAFVRALRASAIQRERQGIAMSGETVPFDPVPILRQLIASAVDFVVIGGLAMRAHGSAHITEDLDVCYGRTDENMAALTAALAPIHPYLRGAPPGLPFRFDVPTIRAGLNFTLTTDYGSFDLLGELSGVGDYDRVVAQSQQEEVFGLRFRVLNLDALIAAKKAAGRLKDRNHILELEELKKLRDAGPISEGGTTP